MFGNRGIKVCGYFLLNWDGEGVLGLPFLLVSRLRVLIAMSTRVSDIFCGRV